MKDVEGYDLLVAAISHKVLLLDIIFVCFSKVKDVEGYDVLVAALLNQVILRTQLVKI